MCGRLPAAAGFGVRAGVQSCRASFGPARAPSAAQDGGRACRPWRPRATPTAVSIGQWAGPASLTPVHAPRPLYRGVKVTERDQGGAYVGQGGGWGSEWCPTWRLRRSGGSVRPEVKRLRPECGRLHPDPFASPPTPMQRGRRDEKGSATRGTGSGRRCEAGSVGRRGVWDRDRGRRDWTGRDVRNRSGRGGAEVACSWSGRVGRTGAPGGQ